MPLWGIFAVRVLGAGFADASGRRESRHAPGGQRHRPLLEVHLFDFDGDLYGQYLSVDFVRRLRDERKFASLDALVEQMHVDARQARDALAG